MEFGRSVGGDHDERNKRLIGLRNAGVQFCSRRTARGHHHDRSSRGERSTERKKSPHCARRVVRGGLTPRAPQLRGQGG